MLILGRNFDEEHSILWPDSISLWTAYYMGGKKEKSDNGELRQLGTGFPKLTSPMRGRARPNPKWGTSILKKEEKGPVFFKSVR